MTVGDQWNPPRNPPSVCPAVAASRPSIGGCGNVGPCPTVGSSASCSLGATEAELGELLDPELIGLAGDRQLAADFDLRVEDLAERASCTVDQVELIYTSLGLQVSELAGFGRAMLRWSPWSPRITSGIVAQVGPQLLAGGWYRPGSARRGGRGSVRAGHRDPFDDAGRRARHGGSECPGLEPCGESGRAAPDSLQAPHVDRGATAAQRPGRAYSRRRSFARRLDSSTWLGSRYVAASSVTGCVDCGGRGFRAPGLRGGGAPWRPDRQEHRRRGDDRSEDPEVMARIALELIADIGDDPSIAPRGGVERGRTCSFGCGDYYGPVVNLASRLTRGSDPRRGADRPADLVSPGLAISRRRGDGRSRDFTAPRGRSRGLCRVAAGCDLNHPVRWWLWSVSQRCSAGLVANEAAWFERVGCAGVVAQPGEQVGSGGVPAVEPVELRFGCRECVEAGCWAVGHARRPRRGRSGWWVRERVAAGLDTGARSGPSRSPRMSAAVLCERGDRGLELERAGASVTQGRSSRGWARRREVVVPEPAILVFEGHKVARGGRAGRVDGPHGTTTGPGNPGLRARREDARRRSRRGQWRGRGARR